MTSPAVFVDIVILCGPDAQESSIAPFQDLARLSVRVAEQLSALGSAPLPLLRVHRADGWRPAREIIETIGTATKAGEPRRADAIAVPAGEGVLEPEPPSAGDAAFLRTQHDAGAWIAALGSGVMTLAGAGLLDDRPAAIPPRNERYVRRVHPGIRLGHASAFVESGRILTAAEPASVFAVAVALARRIHSHGLAERYRRSCGVPETELPCDSLLPGRTNRDLLIAEARAWILAHLHEDIDTAEIAAQFHVSARTLVRRFRLSTGVTPAHFLREARLDAARSMLQMSRFSIDQIANLVGYRDVGFFRTLFRKEVGISPRSYRMAAQQNADSAPKMRE